jgi:hypothetical protein
LWRLIAIHPAGQKVAHWALLLLAEFCDWRVLEAELGGIQQLADGSGIGVDASHLNCVLWVGEKVLQEVFLRAGRQLCWTPQVYLGNKEKQDYIESFS